jgi:alpha-beta hydrolase superfamily lysophospholipase
MEGKEALVQRESGNFTSFDGLKLYDQWWRLQSKPRASVVILHGICEHSGRYNEAAEFLTAQGYAVDTFDLRGHGKSEGIKVYVESFDNYLKDLDVFLDRVRLRLPDMPVFLLGHSMGGGICSMYCITRQPDIRGVILSAPSVKISEDISPFLQKISSVLSKLFPKLPAIKLETADLSRDPEVLKRRDNDPLVYQGKILARTGAEILQATRLIQAQMERISQPLLILHGTEDRLADVEGSKMLYDGVKERDKTLKLYNGLFHEIMNEPEKEQVLHDIVAWMNDHTRS